MSRPSRTDTESTSTGWVANINDNFDKTLGAPVPFVTATSTTVLASTFNPKLYNGCWALVGEVLYRSDGTSWNAYYEPLDYIADLDTLTATVADVQTAYNTLLADLQDKGWML